MKRILIVSIIFVLVLSCMAQARIYKIGVVPWTGWSPSHVADVKGFWKEEGVDVKVFNFPSNMATNTALKNKRIDIKFDMIGTAIELYLEGVPIVAIAETDWSHGGDKIIAKKDLDATQLKDTSIGVYLNQPSVAYFLNHYLSTIGLKIADVRIKILKGWVKAATWIQDPANWKEYMEILNTHTFKGDEPYSETDLQNMVAAVRVHDAAGLLERNQDGGGLHSYLNNLKAFLAANNMLKKDFNPEEIFDNAAIVEALNTP